MSSDYQKKIIAEAVQDEANKLQGETRALEINRPALERIIKFTMDNLALVLHEADRIARNRWGDDIQSGDVDEAIARLAGRSKGDYWNIAIGCALGGAGIQGLADAILSHKGWSFLVCYSAAILIGLLFLYFGAPRR